LGSSPGDAAPPPGPGALDLLREGPVGGRARGERARGDRLDGLLLGLAQLLVVLTVAEHAEVARDAAVAMDRYPRENLLALVEAEALEVEMREAYAPGRVRRVLAIVRRHGL